MQRILPLQLLRNVLLLIWAVSAVGLKEVWPWYFWGTLLSLPVLVLLMQERDFLQSPLGKRIWLICLTLFVFHVIWAYVRAHYYSAATFGTYWKDDHNYFQEAAAIAEAWKQGIYPDIWQKGSAPYLGTIHVGYHRPLAAVFLVTGPSTVAGLLLNAACASLLPMLAALASSFLWRRNTSDYRIKGLFKENSPIYAAAVLTALHPSQFYWASYLMKDMYTAFVFLMTMVMLLGAMRHKSIGSLTAALFLLPYLFSIRIYAALSLIAGAVLLPALHLRKKDIFILGLTGLLTLYLVVAYTSTGHQLSQQMISSLTALAPAGADNPISMLKRLVAGIPALFLAPYAWLKFPDPTPMYGMYPGMWYLYLVGYPLGFAGLYAALRHNKRLALIPIAALGIGGLLFLISAFGGNASRQRFYLEYVMLIFAGYGLAYPSKSWIITILVAEVAFAVGQVLSLS